MNTTDDDGNQRRLATLAADDTEPDTSDIPELPASAWAKAETGRFYRTPSNQAPAPPSPIGNAAAKA